MLMCWNADIVAEDIPTLSPISMRAPAALVEISVRRPIPILLDLKEELSRQFRPNRIEEPGTRRK
jgi:hypothetical protein